LRSFWLQLDPPLRLLQLALDPNALNQHIQRKNNIDDDGKEERSVEPEGYDS